MNAKKNRCNNLSYHKFVRNGLEIMNYFLGVRRFCTTLYECVVPMDRIFFVNPGKHLIVFLNLVMTKYRKKIVRNERTKTRFRIRLSCRSNTMPSNSTAYDLRNITPLKMKCDNSYLSILYQQLCNLSDDQLNIVPRHKQSTFVDQLIFYSFLFLVEIKYQSK